MTSGPLPFSELTPIPEAMPAGPAGNELRACFFELCQVHGLEITFRREATESWQSVLEQAAYVPVAYTQPMLDYQSAYFSSHEVTSVEASIVIMNDRRPCAVWPLMLNLASASTVLGSSNGALLPPLFNLGTSSKTIKSIITRCHELVADFYRHLGKRVYLGQESFVNAEGLGEWYLQAVRSGAVASVGHEMFVDLRLPLQEIRAAIRKSYKPLISKGERLWTATVCASAAPDAWDEFRRLHMEVAGRSTRSLESWARQHDAISAGDAFFVYLRAADDRMVGGGLFHVSRDEGLYAVGAYDRALFDKPLGHLVQYHAINEMKRRALKWYRIGQCAYTGDSQPPTDKEVAISHFKQGFATHHFAVHRFERSVKEIAE